MKTPESFHLIDNTPEVFSRLLKAIENAKESINAEFFTFEGDSIGNQFAEALIKKAKEGVHISLLFDDFSNWKINDKWLLAFHKPGVILSLFKEWSATQRTKIRMQIHGINIKRANSLKFLTFRSSLTSRDHRKLVIIDNKVAFVGGFNISEHNYSWHDTFTEIYDKEVVSALTRIFELKYTYDTYSKDIILVKDTLIAQSTKTLMRYLMNKVESAQKRIYVESPYFVNSKMIKLLQKKYRQGLDVCVILPQKNNNSYIARIHKRYRKQFRSIVCYRTKPSGMFHAKHMVIDDLSVFGSSNFLSAKMIDNHEELSLIVNDKEYNKTLCTYFSKAKATQCT